MVKLPSGYTQLEYIRATGKQYIDTKVTPNQDTNIVVEYKFNTTTPNTAAFFARNSAYGANYGIFLSRGVFQFGYNSRYAMPSSISALDKHTISIINGVCSIDGETYEAPAATFNPGSTLLLCAMHTGTTVELQSQGDLYSCKIPEDGSVRNYIPCVNPNGVAGMFDLATNEFYGSAGAEEFVAGPETIKKEPNIYAKINSVWQPVSAIYTKVNGAW